MRKVREQQQTNSLEMDRLLQALHCIGEGCSSVSGVESLDGSNLRAVEHEEGVEEKDLPHCCDEEDDVGEEEGVDGGPCADGC